MKSHAPWGPWSGPPPEAVGRVQVKLIPGSPKSVEVKHHMWDETDAGSDTFVPGTVTKGKWW